MIEQYTNNIKNSYKLGNATEQLLKALLHQAFEVVEMEEVSV
jgi:hypothetical protein